MALLIYYVVFVLVLNVGAVGLCYVIEQIVPALSMWIFLSLFFISLWLAWVISVRLTEPKVEAHAASAAPPIPGPAE